MEFLGLDLAKMAEVNLPPLTPEAILKNFPLEFLTKPISPITSPPILEGYGCGCGENSWLADVRNVLMDVWKQPVTQLVGVSVAVTGIAVCSWRLCQYWDDGHHTKCKPMNQKPEERAHQLPRLLQPTTPKVPPSFGFEAHPDGLVEKRVHYSGTNETFYDGLDKEGFQNRLGKVIWRVRDIVRDLKQLDSQRRTLQAEIRLHQDNCSKLKELGNIERSKRQAAEDKMKMIELENLQLKQLNQIIAKKASLIDRLEFIIQEKNALESSDPMASMTWVPNESRVESRQEEEVVRTCQLPVRDKPGDNSSKCSLEPELKHTPSVSSCSDKGDKSSSVIVLSEDDQERAQTNPPRWQSPSPVTKTSSFRLQGISSASSSLTNITGTTVHQSRRRVKRRSKSLHESQQEAGWISPRKSADANGEYQDVKHEEALKLARKMSDPNRKRNRDEKENVGEMVGGASLTINKGVVDRADEQNEYTFHISASPPKSHLRSETPQGNSGVTGPSDGVAEGECGDGLENSMKGSSRLQSAEMSGNMADIQKDGKAIASLANQSSELKDADNVIFSKEVTLPTNDQPSNLVARCVSKVNAKASSKTPESTQTITVTSSRTVERNDLEISGEEKTHGVDEHGSKFPGRANVLKKNKQLPSEKPSRPKKCQFQAVRFINKGARDNVCEEEEEDDLQEIKKGDDTWVVIMNQDQSTN